MRITNMSHRTRRPGDRTQVSTGSGRCTHVSRVSTCDCRCHVHDTRSRSKEKENGKMGFGIRFAPSERPAFELRYRSPPAPRPAPGAPPPRRFHSDSRLSYDRTRRFHFMIWAGLGPYLISHYARYLTTLVSQGYSYCVLNCVQLFTECRAVACMMIILHVCTMFF